MGKAKKWINKIVREEVKKIEEKRQPEEKLKKFDYLPKEDYDIPEDLYEVARKRAIDSATKIVNNLDPKYEAYVDIPPTDKGGIDVYIHFRDTRFTVMVRHPGVNLGDHAKPGNENVQDPDFPNTVSKPGWCTLYVKGRGNPNRDDLWPDEQTSYVDYEGPIQTKGIIKVPEEAVKWIKENVGPYIEEAQEDENWGSGVFKGSPRKRSHQKDSPAKSWPSNAADDQTKDSDEYDDTDYL